MSRTRSRRDRRREPDRQSAAAVCPDCGAEFVAGVETCSDCGVVLVPPAKPPERLLSQDGLVSVGSMDEPPHARAGADALLAAGISHHLATERIERHVGEMGPTYGHLFEFYVGPEDEPLARRLLAVVAERPGLDTAIVLQRAEAADAPDSRHDALAPIDFSSPDLNLPDIPAETNRWIGIAHGAAAICWIVVVGLAMQGRGGLAALFAALAVVCHVGGVQTWRGWHHADQARRDALEPDDPARLGTEAEGGE